MVGTSNLIAAGLLLAVFLSALETTVSTDGFMWSQDDMNKVMDVWNAFNTFSTKCNGRIGDCFPEEEMLMDSEINRRNLRRRRSYISYGALVRDSVPCGRRGRSYYSCAGKQANPYRRPCTKITRCARDTG